MAKANKEEYAKLLKNMKMKITFWTIGDRLRALRYEKGVSVDTVAADTGLCRSNIYQWEWGKVEPSNFSLICLSDYYKVSIDYILVGKKSEYER